MLAIRWLNRPVVDIRRWVNQLRKERTLTYLCCVGHGHRRSFAADENRCNEGEKVRLAQSAEDCVVCLVCLCLLVIIGD